MRKFVAFLGVCFFVAVLPATGKAGVEVIKDCLETKPAATASIKTAIKPEAAEAIKDCLGAKPSTTTVAKTTIKPAAAEAIKDCLKTQ